MAREKILVTVKTYPIWSKQHVETCCTAGLRADGTWIRIYPIAFRLLEKAKQYAKYDWIEIDVEKSPKDARPESYRLVTDRIKLLGKIDTSRKWQERRELLLHKGKVYDRLADLIERAHSNELSLATYKPSKILSFEEELATPPSAQKKQDMENLIRQQSLFPEDDISSHRLIEPLDKNFYYRFIDSEGKEHRLRIEDWELGALYRNCKRKYESPKEIFSKVREKYFDDLTKNKELYLFLGTTYQWHNKRAPNPYVIVGTFYPPELRQLNFIF